MNAEHELRLHPVGQHAPDLHRRDDLLGFIGGSGSGSGAPDYTDAQIVGGKNPVWNRFGHERMGWALSVFNPATP